jgi:hypothetical protein
MLSPLQLSDSKCNYIFLELNHDYEESDGEVPLNLRFETVISLPSEGLLSEDPPRALVNLTLANLHDYENYPIKFKIEYQGTFLWLANNDDIEHDELIELIKVNGASILFGQAREMFNILSFRALGYSPSLPTVKPKDAFGGSLDSEIDNSKHGESEE